VEKLPNLTRELILIEFPNYGEIVDKLHAFKKKLKYAYKQSELPSEFFGRSKKIIKKYQKYFDNAKRLISYYRRLPKLKNEFTIVLAGFPNVGKSTFLKNITGANPKIASYPFTTKGLNVGYIDYGIREFQIIDTPGILDREKLNKIEQKAYTAIKNAADLRNKIGLKAPKSQVVIRYIRDGKEFFATVTLAQQDTQFLATKGGARVLDGLIVVEKDDTVIVQEVEQASKAHKKGFKKGDKIVQINQMDIHSLKDLKKALRIFKDKNKIVYFQRGDSIYYVVI